MFYPFANIFTETSPPGTSFWEVLWSFNLTRSRSYLLQYQVGPFTSARSRSLLQTKFAELNSRYEKEYAQQKFMEFSKEIDISGPSITNGAMQQRKPSSMFDMLPDSVVEDEILPYIGNPCCHMCQRKVCFPVASDDKAYQDTNTADAVCLEEVIRNCIIHDPNKNRVGQRRYLLDWSRIEKSHASRHRVIPTPATIERLGLQEIRWVQKSPSPPPNDNGFGWIHPVFVRVDLYFPVETLKLTIKQSDIVGALKRMTECFNSSRIQVEYENNPAGAKLRTLENIELFLIFFEYENGDLAVGIQRRQGDYLEANRYVHRILDAARGWPAPLSEEGISSTAAGRDVSLYEDKDRDDELLGQFRFCLRKRPVRSFVDAISNQIFCGSCATRQQELYFEKEFQRVTEARDALIEAWFITEHQIKTKKAKKIRIPPPYYHKQQKKNRKQNSKMERRGKFRGR